MQYVQYSLFRILEWQNNYLIGVGMKNQQNLSNLGNWLRTDKEAYI